MNKRILLVLLSVLLLAAGCTGAPVAPSWAGLVLVGDAQNILLSYNDRLVLIDPTNGRPVPLRNADGQVRVDASGNPRAWEVVAPGNVASGFYAPPVSLDNNNFLVATYTQQLFNLDLSAACLNDCVTNPTGVQLLGHVVARPLVADGIVYIAYSDNNHGIAAYDAASLEKLWSFATDHGIWTTPLLVDGTLYIPSLNHFLYALDARTGEERWRADLQGALTATPVYVDGRLYIGTLTRRVLEVSAADGTVLNTFQTNDWVWGALVYVDGTLYAADMAGWVYALDVSDQGFNALWSQKVANGGIRAAPVVVDGMVIVGARDHKVYWRSAVSGEPILDAEGNPLVRELGGEILADLLVIYPNDVLTLPEPILIVSTMLNSQLLVAMTLDNGQRLWEYGR